MKGLTKSVLWVDIECENDALMCPDRGQSFGGKQVESERKASEWLLKKKCVVSSLRYEEVFGGKMVPQRLEELMRWKSGYNVTMDVYTFPSDS
uniref:AlNc14C432G11598 protein n=1 Tax=Albugo laibachii Nc14 TaxID=890382 RepID=F0WZK7_9STRA|nr:AlNc14C432G11598 [Albugo laibachii Nc14]|eukprot:CCA26931.1 AlNc14C432G11598 [Albugo laibachii Nc14]